MFKIVSRDNGDSIRHRRQKVANVEIYQCSYLFSTEYSYVNECVYPNNCFIRRIIGFTIS